MVLKSALPNTVSTHIFWPRRKLAVNLNKYVNDFRGTFSNASKAAMMRCGNDHGSYIELNEYY